MDLRAALEANERGELPLGPTDFYYRTLVPKGLRANLLYRKRVLELGYSNREYARQLFMFASRDILWYISTFCWTLNTKEYPKQPIRPFIPYPYQERAILELQEALGNDDVWITKSRDMGASWICLFVMEHRWHFSENQLFGLASEKEELVDGPSEKTLMRKLDWIHARMPLWLMPSRRIRVKKHLNNPDMHSSFDGEATVANLATGDRRTAMLLDEFSKNEHADKILTSTRDVTRCRVMNSTPNGAFGVGQTFFEMGQNPHVRKLFLHWTEHPEKAKGLYKLVNGEKVPLDWRTYDWRKDYDFNLLKFVGEKARSPWYDKQCQRAKSDKEIAQELDMDFQSSSERFADEQLMSRVLKEDCRPPLHHGRPGVDSETLELTWHAIPDGPFKLWCPLELDPVTNSLRPPKGEYAVGGDVSAGTAGQYSSNSAYVVFNRRTGEQVGRFAVNHLKPESFCRYGIGVCKWLWDALLIPEVNGGLGQQYLNELKDQGYWNVWRREVENIDYDSRTERIGYVHKDGGMKIMGDLLDKIARRKIILRDEMIAKELLEYEWAKGKIVHKRSSRNESDSDKGQAHGDTAIAAGCGGLGVDEQNAAPEAEKPVEEAPRGSIAWLLARRESESDRLDPYARVTDTDW